MFKTTGIDHVAVNTNDMEATLQFYCGVLGMRLSVPHAPGTDAGTTTWRLAAAMPSPSSAEPIGQMRQRPNT